MKILIAPDSFKESLSAKEVATAIAKGFEQVFPDAQLLQMPLADGGEGTVDILIDACEGEAHRCWVTSAMGERINASWGLLAKTNTAVIDIAAASGLAQVCAANRNPMLATSKGSGELIVAALDCGCEHIILGLGGSACNDAGAGMLQALGVKLMDAKGREIGLGGGALKELASIDSTGLDPRLKNVRFEIACDVENILLGAAGATAVFSAQKGATKVMQVSLEKNLAHFSQLVRQHNDIDITVLKGGGAAGGIAAGISGFLDVSIKSGIDMVLDTLNFDQQVASACLVVTGEGRIDSQSAYGKVPSGVAKRAKAHECPVFALAGAVEGDLEALHQQGLNAAFSITPGVISLEHAMENAANNLTQSARNLASALAINLSVN